MINFVRRCESFRVVCQLAALALGAELLTSMPARADDSVSKAAQNTDCSKYDQYRLRGSEAPFITICDTLSPEMGGLRRTMYASGWLMQDYGSVTEQYDLRNADSSARQAYAGQRPTFIGSNNFILTYDLSRAGFFGPNAQFGMQVQWYQNSYVNNGLRATYVKQLSIEQEFDEHRVRFEYGIFNLNSKFYGSVLGTSSAASALGPSSSLLNEVGMADFKPGPAFDIRLYSPSMRFYNHFGISRSLSPDGFLVDSRYNHTGLNLSGIPGARVLIVDEVGYRLYPKANQLALWLRAGAVYNTSYYFNYRDGKPTVGNQAYYLAFTKQYTQTDADNPVRGLYTDVKVDQAPADHNTYDKDFLFSLYSIGPFAHRPNDMVTFGYQYKWVSEWARLHTIIKSEITPIHNSSSLSLSYAMHLHRGVYWTNSLSYTNHPVFAPAHPGVLVLGSTVYLSF